MISAARPAAIGVATDDPLATLKLSVRSFGRLRGHAAATPSPRIAKLQSGVAGGLWGEGLPLPSLECIQMTCLILAGNDIGFRGFTPELEAAAKIMMDEWKASLKASLICSLARL